MNTKLDQRGRVVIPAEYRRALGLRPGDLIVLLLEDGEVRMLSLARAIRRAQAIVHQYVPAARSLSDERRAES